MLHGAQYSAFRPWEDAYKVFLPNRIVPHWLNQVAGACEASSQHVGSGDDKWINLNRAWASRLRKNDAADNSEEVRKL